MLTNYIKTAWRTITKDKVYATINILGLTIGLSACMMVFTVVVDERSYDNYWTHADNLYKMYQDKKMGDGMYQKIPHSPAPLGLALKDNFPEVVQFAEITTSEQHFRITQGDADGVRAQVLEADTNALTMLDFEAVDGPLPHFVAGQTNLLITESFRNRYFKGKNPVGQLIEDVPSWSEETTSFLITGVIKDIPENTHLRADVVALTQPTSRPLSEVGLEGGGRVYYQLKAGTDVQAFTHKMNDWIQHYSEDPGTKQLEYGLQPITDVYLDSGYDSVITTRGSQRTIHILIGVGALLLFIACINFINLTTAQAMKRLKETGVRKILGAQRSHLVGQFLTESLLFFAIATLLAISLYALALPVVESFMGHTLVYSLLANWKMLSIALLLVFAISLLTGVYPAWLLSGFKPANTLRSKFTRSSLFGAGELRKLLVVVQFSIAIVVLVSLLVVKGQVNYLTNKPMGYEKENLLNIGLRSWEGRGETFKNELEKLPGIESASIARWDPVNGTPSFSTTIDHPLRDGEKIDVHFITADFDFSQTMGFELQQGRYLNTAYGSDTFSLQATWRMDSLEYRQYIDSRSVLITTSTAKLFGIQQLDVPVPKLGYQPVGILHDFHRESLYHALGPVFIVGDPNPNYAQMFIRTVPGMNHRAQHSLETLWREFYPNRLLDAQWVADMLDKQYEAVHKQQTLFTFFSGLMLFLSAMGVFGLIRHAAQQRVKEIGIRKVLGARVSGIVAMLSTDFMKLVVAAIVAASPIAWWIMNNWLEDFAYRIDMRWWMFAVSGVVAIVITLLTVSWQALRAAVANPVDSLRDE